MGLWLGLKIRSMVRISVKDNDRFYIRASVEVKFRATVSLWARFKIL